METRSRSKLLAKRQQHNNKSPFNNYFVLEKLFQLGTKNCHFSLPTKDLLSLRTITSKSYQTSKPFVSQRIGILEFDFYPAPKGKRKLCKFMWSNPFDIWMKSNKNFPTTLRLEKLMLNYDTPGFVGNKFYTNGDLPHPYVISKYKEIIECLGSSVKIITFAFKWTIRNLLNHQFTEGLNVFGKFTNLSTIVINCCSDGRIDDFKTLHSVLPNPDLINTIQLVIYLGYSTNFYAWVTFPFELFELFVGLKKLYYFGTIMLTPINALDFLNRDSRIQFFEPYKYSSSPRKSAEFWLKTFIPNDQGHKRLFESLTTDTSSCAAQLVIWGEYENVLLFKPLILAQNWERLSWCKFNIKKLESKWIALDEVVNKGVHLFRCNCCKAEYA